MRLTPHSTGSRSPVRGLRSGCDPADELNVSQNAGSAIRQSALLPVPPVGGMYPADGGWRAGPPVVQPTASTISDTGLPFVEYSRKHTVPSAASCTIARLERNWLAQVLIVDAVGYGWSHGHAVT